MAMRTRSTVTAYCDLCSFQKVLKSESEMPPHNCPACGDGKWSAIYHGRDITAQERGIKAQTWDRLDGWPW